nr:MAG TPA: WSK motif protein [Caudoviricetes sp.]
MHRRLKKLRAISVNKKVWTSIKNLVPLNSC